MDRRNFLKSTGLTLSATAAGLTVPGVASAQSEPIRIGMMAPLSGVVAAGGREMVDGFKMYWESVGYETGGRKVEVIVEDDAGNPDAALQKARRLVEKNKVDFLFGNLLANTGLAVANYVKSNGTPYFIPIIAADDLTQRARVENVIRVA
jgi:branched-chain amino acid transport system substrate-binding protein